VYRPIIAPGVSFFIYFNVSYTIFGVSEQEKLGGRDVAARTGERPDVYKVSMGRPEGRSPFITLRSRWVYIIKIEP
jgi:hypothetical protein